MTLHRLHIPHEFGIESLENKKSLGEYLLGLF